MVADARVVLRTPPEMLAVTGRWAGCLSRNQEECRSPAGEGNAGGVTARGCSLPVPVRSLGGVLHDDAPGLQIASQPVRCFVVTHLACVFPLADQLLDLSVVKSGFLWRHDGDHTIGLLEGLKDILGG